MKPTKTELTARDLLRIHNGACSVPRNGPLHLAFCKMQEAGLVRIDRSSTHGLVDIRTKETPRETPKV